MRMPVLVTAVFLVGSALSLAACLGGGGSSGGAAVATVGGPRPFTSWDNVRPFVPVEIPGEGQESSFTRERGVPPGNIESLAGFADVPVNVTVRYDSDQIPTSLVIETSQSTNTWGVGVQSDQFENLGAAGFPQFDAAISGNENDIALIGNPFFLDWNYQTFGVWVTETGVASGRLGTFSVGSITQSGQVPIVGTATYDGSLVGAYVAPDGTDFLATADVQLNAAFQTNTLGFLSTNTQLTRDLQTFTEDDTLDLGGTLTWSDGSNTFSGPVQSQVLNGQANGSFYGPNVEELGGNFLVTNPDPANSLETYVGSFGAARGPID